MNIFIKLHSVLDGEIAVNTHWILTFKPATAGCNILFAGEDRPLLVRESFEDVERIIGAARWIEEKR